MSRFLLAVFAAISTFIGPDVLAQQDQKAATPITVLSGCLRQSRADTTTANQKGVIYTLEATAQKLPTSPAPEGSGPIKIDDRYALSFDASVDLSKHVNHRVEVRGRLLPIEAGNKSPAAPKPLPGAAEKMFHVTELKMISATCEK